MKGRSKSSKSVLIVSDMHVGSTTAVCTKDPVIADQETSFRPNKLQSELLNVWHDVIDDLIQKPKVLVVNGEPCDGGNFKGLGKQSWSTNISDQLDDAEKLLNFIPHDNILFTRGSGYHVDIQGTNFEEVIAKKMKALQYKAYGGNGYTDYYALLELHNKRFNFTHHVGFNKWASYRTTALAREMAGMVFEKDKMGHADVIVRSHVHYFVHVEFVNTHGFTTPAWKYPDGHLFRSGTAGTTPDIGMVEVIIEPNGKVLIEKHISSLKIKPKVIKL